MGIEGHNSDAGLSRRGFIQLGASVAAGAAVAGLAGCSTSTGSGSGTTTLRWLMWSQGSPAQDQAFTQIAKMVAEKNPKIELKIEFVPNATYYDKLLTELAGGSPPDLFAMQNVQLPDYVARNVVLPIKDYVSGDAQLNYDDFLPAIRDTLAVNDVPYGLPYDVGPWILVYNKDLFRRAGLGALSPTEPITFDEFRNYALKITALGGGVKGYVYRNTQVPDLGQWLWSNGADYMNTAATECLVGTKAATDTLEWYLNLRNVDKVVQDPTDLTKNVSTNQFNGGQIGMMMNGEWAFSTLSSGASFDWDIAPAPAGSAGSITPIIGSGYVISRATRNKDAAWEALRTITSADALKLSATKASAMPGRQSVMSTYLSSNAKPANLKLMESLLAGTAGQAKARSLRVTYGWGDITTMWKQDMTPAFIGQSSLSSAISTTVPAFNSILASAKRPSQ